MDIDPSLRRIERAAIMFCLGMVVPAFALAGVPAALGVLGGGLLSAVSYRTIVSSVTALTSARPTLDAEPSSQRSGRGWTLVKAAGRYALLALLAYVMIARLRLHPLGLLAGASSIVAAIALEAARFVAKKP